MTNPVPVKSLPDINPVRELVQRLIKGQRAIQLYLPNNPVFRRSIDAVRDGFAPVWEESHQLELEVTESSLRWEDTVVYEESDKAESLAWLLYKDGVRRIRMMPGVEDEEIVSFLDILRAAQQLPADAEDDLLTLLWEADFKHLSYRFVEPGEGIPELGPTERAPVPTAETIRHTVDQAIADPEPQAVVDLQDFDASLYVVDEHETEYLQREIEREYRQDVRANLLAILFDLFELQTRVAVRSEVVGIIEGLIPTFLRDGDFQSVSYILRELRVVVARADELLAGHKGDLEEIPARLSEPEVFEQLLESLDQAVVPPSEEELGAFFGDLRPDALRVAVARLGRLGNPQIRSLLDAAVQRLARAHPKAMSIALKATSTDPDALLSAVRLVKWLRLPSVAPELGELLNHQDVRLRVEVVAALGEIATPRCLDLLESAVLDPAREVRIAAVRVFGTRRDKRAWPRVRDFVRGRQSRATDMTERLAFFEAYGQIGGAGVVDPLAAILHQRGFMRREEPDTRACAAMGLARVGTAEAKTVLERAGSEKDPVVRNAVRRALRDLERRR